MDSIQRSVGTPVAAQAAASASGRMVPAAQAEKATSSVQVPISQASRADVVRKPEPAFDPKQMQQRLQQVVDEMNSRMRETNRNLAFGVDQELNRFVIKVTNRTSGELVRQIPGDAVLAVAHSIEDLKGVLYEDFV
jgi:flagellar protein FlaG